MRKFESLTDVEVVCLIQAMRQYHGHRSLNEDEAEPALSLVEDLTLEQEVRESHAAAIREGKLSIWGTDVSLIGEDFCWRCESPLMGSHYQGCPTRLTS